MTVGKCPGFREDEMRYRCTAGPDIDICWECADAVTESDRIRDGLHPIAEVTVSVDLDTLDCELEAAPPASVFGRMAGATDGLDEDWVRVEQGRPVEGTPRVEE